MNSMQRGAKEANEESAQMKSIDAQNEIILRLDTMNHILMRILEETMKEPPQHLWPKQ